MAFRCAVFIRGLARVPCVVLATSTSADGAGPAPVVLIATPPVGWRTMLPVAIRSTSPPVASIWTLLAATIWTSPETAPGTVGAPAVMTVRNVPWRYSGSLSVVPICMGTPRAWNPFRIGAPAAELDATSPTRMAFTAPTSADVRMML